MAGPTTERVADHLASVCNELRPGRAEIVGGLLSRGFPRSFPPRWWLSRITWLPTIALCLLHSLGIVLAMGGWSGVTGPWPLALHDHPHHFHNATMTRALVRVTGTDAG